MAETRGAVGREDLLPGEPAGRAFVRFRIDGREAVAPAGSTILEAAEAQGISIPTLCHHPALGPSGSCRVCLVEVGPSSELVPACSTPVVEGLECRTDSAAVARARADRIEILLANHPLDCPVCDRSGDCRLQDLAFAYGRDARARGEPPRTGAPRRLGERILFWPERCVLCLRCVRFAEEVSGTSALYVDASREPPRVEVAPGLALDDGLSGNLVDLCPVGALAEAESAGTVPAWLVERRATICAECARGCAIVAQVFRGRVVRVSARENPAVNGSWICDRGRGATDPLGGRKRRLAPSSLATALGEAPASALAAGLERFVRARGPEALAGLVSSFATLEEILLFRRLFEAVAAPRGNIAVVERSPGEEARFPGGFWVSSDRNPNRAGAEALLGPECLGDARLAAVARALEKGTVRGLFVLDGRPRAPFGCAPLEERILVKASALEFFAIFELAESPATERALAFPATTPLEKEGTVLSSGGLLQRIRRCAEPPAGVRPEIEVLEEALAALGARSIVAGPQGVFREVAAELGRPDWEWDRPGRLGPAEPGAARSEDGHGQGR